MAAAIETNLEPRYIDVDRQVQRALAPGGLTYWLWVLFCALLTALGIGYWTNQVYKGLGVTGLTCFDDEAARRFTPWLPGHDVLLAAAVGCT